MAKGKFAKQKKRRFWPFLLGMVIYAGVFLFALNFGLQKFWDYMDAYEKSRPQNTIVPYVAQLDAEDVCDGSAELIAGMDPHVQDEETCRALISDAVAEGITYAKKTSDCTDTRFVYVLRSGSTVIGSVAMEVTATDEYGFNQWEVTDTTFDMSHLIGGTVGVKVLDDYRVYVNGVLLDERYITESDIRFDVLELFYDDYDLPTMVVYEAGPFLGEAVLTVTDAEGTEMVIDENTDYDALLNNCSPEETEMLNTFAEDFIDHYVAFTGSAFKSSQRSYKALMEYVVPDSELANRMALALEGLEWAQSRGDELVSVTMNMLHRIEDGVYLCDVTYQVDTTGREGVVRTTNSARFIVVEDDDELLVKTLVAY